MTIDECRIGMRVQPDLQPDQAPPGQWWAPWWCGDETGTIMALDGGWVDVLWDEGGLAPYLPEMLKPLFNGLNVMLDLL